MVGHDEWIDEESPLSITEQANIHAGRSHAWMAKRHDARMILELARHVPHPARAPSATAPNIPATDHFQRVRIHRPQSPGAASTNLTGRTGSTHGPARTPESAPRLGHHDRLTTASRQRRTGPRCRRCNCYRPRQWSRRCGPVVSSTSPASGGDRSCTHVLAMLGAEVIHSSRRPRPDGTRLIAGVPVTEPSGGSSRGIFSGLNTNKKGVTLDFQTERGRELLRRLIATCDVHRRELHAAGDRAIGLDFDTVRALREDIVMVRMPGFGLDGPWRDDPAFAYVIEDASGLTWLTGYPDQNPVEPYSVGDPNAGVHALSALAARARSIAGARGRASRSRRRWSTPRSTSRRSRSSSTRPTERCCSETATAVRPPRRRTCTAPPNSTSSAARDDWVAIAVATDDQWAGWRDALGHPAGRCAELTTAPVGAATTTRSTSVLSDVVRRPQR